MKIKNISHIAVGVRDMDRSLGFFRDVLGMHVSLDAIEELPPIGDAPAIKRRGVYLRWREGDDESFIVLDQQLSRAPFGEPAQTFQVGTHHWGLWVDDVEAMVARAEKAGVPIVVRPANGDSLAYGEPAGRVVRTAFLRDPDGNLVQLDQRA